MVHFSFIQETQIEYDFRLKWFESSMVTMRRAEVGNHLSSFSPLPNIRKIDIKQNSHQWTCKIFTARPQTTLMYFLTFTAEAAGV